MRAWWAQLRDAMATAHANWWWRRTERDCRLNVDLMKWIEQAWLWRVTRTSMRSRFPLKSSKTRHNKVVTPQRSTTLWPANKLPKRKVDRTGEDAISNRGTR